MALYHFNVTQVSRGKGQSAVASAAYRSGEKLNDDYYGTIQDYTKKGGVLYTEILLPPYAPERFLDRETLWNEVEVNEKHPKAQLAYSFNVALQNEFTYEENLVLTKQFVTENFVDKGMIVDLAIHDPDKGEGGIQNPHFHVIAPIRPLNKDGTWGSKQKREYLFDEDGKPLLDKNGKQKFNAVSTTDWGTPETLMQWRKNWASLVNAKFEEKGMSERIDHRSYCDRDMDILPTIHEGPTVRAMEKKGIQTDVGNWNRLIKATNAIIKRLRSEISELANWISSLQKEIAQNKSLEKYQKAESNAFVQALQSYYDERNAGAYSNKAKVRNIKQQAEAINFLTENKISTLNDLEGFVRSMYAKVSDIQQQMKPISEEQKEIKEILKAYEDYERYRPIYSTMYAIRNAKEKERFKEKHRAELNQYYMSRRILSEHYPDNKVPVAKLKNRLEELNTDYSAYYDEYKSLKAEASKDYSLQKAINADYKKIVGETIHIKTRKENEL